MKCQVPQISWHGRDPVLSIDFQPVQNDVMRLATGGTDSHVLIWYITYQDNKSVKIECASDLYRHRIGVNAVRFSPKGNLLASGDDEGTIFIWELKERDQMIEAPNDDDEIVNKEEWYTVKLLRGHLNDIFDICWSKDGNFLASSSMDNTVIMWDMQKYMKTHIFSEYKGYVQGVTWDPLNQFIASIGTDRALRIHNINSKKTVYKISKAPWTNSTEKGTFRARLFYDDTLQSYCRRLTFTPDGELLIVPSGILEKGDKIENSCYVFSRHALNKPAISLPTGDKYTVAVKCNPFLYKLRKPVADDKENEQQSKPMINLPYRMIFAVAASDSVLLYDTQQLVPFAFVSNIHYTRLTDLSWSPDGLSLVVSSTDGYCSFILFTREELGEIYVPEKPKEVEKELTENMDPCINEKMDVSEPSQKAIEKEIKNISNPSTPKRITPIQVKSPKVPSSANEEASTPSSKPVKNAADIKKPIKKSPKMCSIKKFFISPKTSVTTNKVSENVQQSCNEKDASKKTENGTEVIELSDSPMKVTESIKKGDALNKINCADSEKVKTQDAQAEAMDVEVTSEAKNTEVSPKLSSSEKHAKCKVRLNFVDKDDLMANIDDNASDSNPVSSQSIAEDIDMEPAENDWKLELSQDEDIVPLKTQPLVVESNPTASPKPILAGPSSSGAKIEDKKTPESKQTTKRRVAFITLSSKSSAKKN